MDHFRIWYIGDGYVEGIPVAIYENDDRTLPDADNDLFPVREYDTGGRLTHFKTPTNDAHGSFLIKIDYEYDDQNRISRLTYEYDLREESDDYAAFSPLYPPFPLPIKEVPALSRDFFDTLRACLA